MSKFITFREGCFVIRNWMQVLKWSSWDFLSPLILQKMKEDNISQSGDYDASFCEQQCTHVSCYISLWRVILLTTMHTCILLYLFVQIQIIWSVNTPQTASSCRHSLSCATIVKLKEVNDANQHFYELKRCQKNNWIKKKTDRVNWL